MKKITIGGWAAIAAVGALAAGGMVFAQTVPPLAVTCSGSVSSNVITWNAVATGGNAPYAFAWSGDSNVAGRASTSVVATYVANGTYTANILATDASSTVATSTCSGTVTSFVPAPTSTPPLPHINQPSLSIGPKGNFTARSMTVTSVASGSFQAQVWGITYTVNWSGDLFPQFLLRNGNMTSSTIATQIAVGDEVGVSGKISTSTPFVVNADLVRDYNIVIPRPPHGNPGKDDDNGPGNGKVGPGPNVNANANANIQGKFSGFLNLFKNLFHK